MTAKLRSLALILLASTSATALAQDNPLDKLKPIAPKPNLPAVKHRMEILNGSRLSITYFAQPGATDQDIDALVLQARREEDKFNSRIPDSETGAPLAFANVRPGDPVVPPAGPQIVTIILKSGVSKTGDMYRATDHVLFLRTAENDDFEILRSEVAAISRKR